MAPKSTFGELSALIEKCDLIIANDSGPMHAAAALGKPTLGIFGPTDPEAHRPFQKTLPMLFIQIFTVYLHKTRLSIQSRMYAGTPN